MRLRVLTSSVLLGLLAACLVWSVAWTMQARQDRTYSTGKDPVSVQLVDSVEPQDPSEAVSKLAAVLEDRGTAVVIDPGGNGVPGLTILDPRGALPWLSPFSNDLRPGEQRKAVLFDSTYCAREWRATASCPLLPPDTQVLGVTNGPSDRGEFQYALIPPQTGHLSSGVYIFSSADENLLQDLAPALTAAGMQVQDVVAPPLWEELSHNPLILMSFALFNLGLLIATVYWRASAGSLMKQVRVRYSSGATAPVMVKEGWTASLVPTFAGAFTGALASGVLVGAISQVRLPPNVVGWLTVAAVGVSVVIMLVLFAILRLTVGHELEEPAHAQ